MNNDFIFFVPSVLHKALFKNTSFTTVSPNCCHWPQVCVVVSGTWWTQTKSPVATGHSSWSRTFRLDVSDSVFFCVFRFSETVVPYWLWFGQEIPRQPNTAAHPVQRRQEPDWNSTLRLHQRSPWHWTEVCEHSCYYIAIIHYLVVRYTTHLIQTLYRHDRWC